MRVCRSPELIAAYRGLHRLYVPRHPPHTFIRLTLSQLFKQSTRIHLKNFRVASAAHTPTFVSLWIVSLTEVLRPLS